MAPEWLFEKKIKLLEYKYITYSFKAISISISYSFKRDFEATSQSIGLLFILKITGCQIPVLFFKSTPELGRIFSNFISHIKQSENFPKTQSLENLKLNL